MFLFFKYCADVENCGASRGFGFIYIYIYRLISIFAYLRTSLVLFNEIFILQIIFFFKITLSLNFINIFY